MFFEALRVAGDTWHTMSGSQCATCQVQDASNNELNWGYRRHVACHTPIPSPTRLADSNRVRGARPDTETLYLFFFSSELNI